MIYALLILIILLMFEPIRIIVGWAFVALVAFGIFVAIR
jgi:hypothetical protein